MNDYSIFIPFELDLTFRYYVSFVFRTEFKVARTHAAKQNACFSEIE